MKVIEYTLTTIIRNQVGISAMQFGFMPGRGTSDAIFVLQQVHLGKQKDLYLAFIGLEKAFNSMPRKEMWWAMGKRGEWFITTAHTLDNYSPWFDVQVGIHQDFIVSSFLLINVIEILSLYLRTGSPWELRYADDLVITAETPDELLQRFRVWKTNLQAKGLRVNIGKAKIMVSAHNALKPVEASKFSYGVCNKGVGSNSVKCFV